MEKIYKAYGKDYLLRIYFFSLILEGFQNACSVQNQPSLFVLVVKLQQHVLNLTGRQAKAENNKAMIITRSIQTKHGTPCPPSF